MSISWVSGKRHFFPHAVCDSLDLPLKLVRALIICHNGNSAAALGKTVYMESVRRLNMKDFPCCPEVLPTQKAIFTERSPRDQVFRDSYKSPSRILSNIFKQEDKVCHWITLILSSCSLWLAGHWLWLQHGELNGQITFFETQKTPG